MILLQVGEPKESWIYRLPLQLACFLLAICLIASQINPCDATSVSLGYSLPFILLVLGIGFLTAMDSVLSPRTQGADSLYLWLRLAFAGFAVWLWHCTAYVPGQGNARFAYNGCWQWIAEGLLTLSIARLSFRFRISAPLIALMLACTAGTVAHAGYKYIVTMPALRARFASDPNSVFAEMNIEAGSAEAMQFANRLGSLEPIGPFALTNSLAGIMAAWLVFLVVLLGSRGAANTVNASLYKARLGSLIFCATLVVGFFVTLLLTKSRSAWLASMICLLAACVLHPTLRQFGWNFVKQFRITSAVTVLVCFLALGGVLARDPMIMAEAGKSLSYRFDYWRGAVELIEAKPWTGYGVANFQANYNRVKVITASESPADPHNFLLETATAGGLPLLAILVAILAILFFKMLEISRLDNVDAAGPFRSKALLLDEGRIAIVLGGLVGCVGILLFGIFFSDADSLASSFFFVAVSVSVFLMAERLHWIVNDQECAAAGLIATCVVLVHLLASGGWMQPGLMNTVCVLVGLTFGLSPSWTEYDTAQRGRLAFVSAGTVKCSLGPLSLAYIDDGTGQMVPSFLGSQKRDGLQAAMLRATRFFPIAGLLFIIMTAADFARTMCLPVSAAPTMKSAISSKDLAIQEPSELLRIIQVDPFDPELPLLAANQCVELLRRNDRSSIVKQKYADVFDACCREYVRRDPNQWMPYAQCGILNAILVDSEPVRDQGNPSFVSRKESVFLFFSKAALLYPNSVATQLQAAVGAAWCGKYTEAKYHLSKVESIERETPHADRKLSAITVYIPKETENFASPLDRPGKMGLQAGYAKGEPVLQWLRTIIP